MTARMKGWQTRTFTDMTCQHNKKTQSGRHSSLWHTARSGYHDYLMGSHPLWQVFRSAYHMGKTPYLLGGGALLAGYLWACISRPERSVSTELKTFRQREQFQRLRNLFARFTAASG